jgi:hypothetical protein
VILLFVIGACTRIPLEITVMPSILPTPIPDEDISFASLPLPVQRFHRHLDFVEAEYVFVATWYPKPYPGYFHVLHLDTEGNIGRYAEIPDWAVHGGSAATLTADESEAVDVALSTLAKAYAPTTEEGESVIVLNFKIERKVHLITCTEVECPREIRYLFEVAEDAFQRAIPGLLVSSPFKSEEE